jgi:hypothetical protein
MFRNQYIMLSMTRDNMIRYLPTAVLAAVFLLVYFINGFLAQPVTAYAVAGHAFAYHSLAGGHENV